MAIGDRKIYEDNEIENETIIVPSDLLIPSSGDPLASNVNNTYPNLLENMNDITFFQNRAILTTKNSLVEKIN